MKPRIAIIVFILSLLIVPLCTVALSQVVPFCFPTGGTLGYRFNEPLNEETHKGIDIWTGNWPENIAAPGNAIHLVYDGKLEMILEGSQYPGGPKDGVSQSLVFSHEIDPSFTDKVQHLKINSWYFHLADQKTGASYIDQNLKVGERYSKGTFLGYQGDRKYYQAGSNESIITHLHFDIRLPDSNIRIDPGPYLGFSLNYNNPDVLPEGTEFNNSCALQTPLPPQNLRIVH